MDNNHVHHEHGPQPGTEAHRIRLQHQMVEALAPKLFALIEESFEPGDGTVLAWGMAFDHHVEIAGASNNPWRGRFETAERARQLLDLAGHGDVTLVWVGTVTA